MRNYISNLKLSDYDSSRIGYYDPAYCRWRSMQRERRHMKFDRVAKELGAVFLGSYIQLRSKLQRRYVACLSLPSLAIVRP